MLPYSLCILIYSGCPEAVKIIVGHKTDLTAEVDISQVRVSCIDDTPFNNTPPES